MSRQLNFVVCFYNDNKHPYLTLFELKVLTPLMFYFAFFNKHFQVIFCCIFHCTDGVDENSGSTCNGLE